VAREKANLAQFQLKAWGEEREFGRKIGKDRLSEVVIFFAVFGSRRDRSRSEPQDEKLAFHPGKDSEHSEGRNPPNTRNQAKNT
jgi:hypothetical protein